MYISLCMLVCLSGFWSNDVSGNEILRGGVHSGDSLNVFEDTVVRQRSEAMSRRGNRSRNGGMSQTSRRGGLSRAGGVSQTSAMSMDHWADAKKKKRQVLRTNNMEIDTNARFEDDGVSRAISMSVADDGLGTDRGMVIFIPGTTILNREVQQLLTTDERNRHKKLADSIEIEKANESWALRTRTRIMNDRKKRARIAMITLATLATTFLSVGLYGCGVKGEGLLGRFRALFGVKPSDSDVKFLRHRLYQIEGKVDKDSSDLRELKKIDGRLESYEKTKKVRTYEHGFVDGVRREKGLLYDEEEFDIPDEHKFDALNKMEPKDLDIVGADVDKLKKLRSKEMGSAKRQRMGIEFDWDTVPKDELVNYEIINADVNTALDIVEQKPAEAAVDPAKGWTRAIRDQKQGEATELVTKMSNARDELQKKTDDWKIFLDFQSQRAKAVKWLNTVPTASTAEVSGTIEQLTKSVDDLTEAVEKNVITYGQKLHDEVQSYVEDNLSASTIEDYITVCKYEASLVAMSKVIDRGTTGDFGDALDFVPLRKQLFNMATHFREVLQEKDTELSRKREYINSLSTDNLSGDDIKYIRDIALFEKSLKRFNSWDRWDQKPLTSKSTSLLKTHIKKKAKDLKTAALLSPVCRVYVDKDEDATVEHIVDIYEEYEKCKITSEMFSLASVQCPDLDEHIIAIEKMLNKTLLTKKDLANVQKLIDHTRMLKVKPEELTWRSPVFDRHQQATAGGDIVWGSQKLAKAVTPRVMELEKLQKKAANKVIHAHELHMWNLTKKAGTSPEKYTRAELQKYYEDIVQLDEFRDWRKSFEKKASLMERGKYTSMKQLLNRYKTKLEKYGCRMPN